MGCSEEEKAGWREYCKSLGKSKYKFEDPLDRPYDGTNLREIVDGDKRAIRKSDIFLVNFYKPSVGTAMEILLAYQLDLDVHAVVKDENLELSPWLIYHVHHIHSSFEDFFKFIKV